MYISLHGSAPSPLVLKCNSFFQIHDSVPCSSPTVDTKSNLFSKSSRARKFNFPRPCCTLLTYLSHGFVKLPSLSSLFSRGLYLSPCFQNAQSMAAYHQPLASPITLQLRSNLLLLSHQVHYHVIIDFQNYLLLFNAFFCTPLIPPASLVSEKTSSCRLDSLYFNRRLLIFSTVNQPLPYLISGIVHNSHSLLKTILTPRGRHIILVI